MTYYDDVLQSGPDRRRGPKRGVVIGVAALAVIVTAGVGGVLVGRQVNRPASVIAEPQSADSVTSGSQESATDISPQADVAAPPRIDLAPGFPSSATWEVSHGYWAVYLAVHRPDRTAGQSRARQEARAVGYHETELVKLHLGCEAGGREGLKAAGIALDPYIDYMTVALFFNTRAEAAQFVDAYEPKVVAMVPVAVTCAE